MGNISGVRTSSSSIAIPWTTSSGNRYLAKTCSSSSVENAASCALPLLPSFKYESSRSSESKTAISEVKREVLPSINRTSKSDRLRNVGVSLLKRFSELDAFTGKPLYPVKMPIYKFVEWLNLHAEALNECAQGTEQAAIIAKVFKINLVGRGKEIVPLIPCIELSKTEGKKKGDFPVVIPVPFHERNRYFKHGAGYFTTDALPESQQKIFTCKEEVDAIVIEATKCAGFGWDYTRDGCEARARIMYHALRCMGVSKKSMFLQYYVGDIDRYDWGFHVALAVRLSNGQLLIVDPSLNSKSSMTVQEWIRKFHNDTEYELVANNLLALDSSNFEGAFYTSCDHCISCGKLTVHDYNFFKKYSSRAGLFAVILQLMNSLANAPRLISLMQEVWIDYRLLWLPPIWIKFEKSKLFEVYEVYNEGGTERQLTFNFTLAEIETLDWLSEYEEIGVIKEGAIKLFDNAISSCHEEINRLDVEQSDSRSHQRLNAKTRSVLEMFRNELIVKKKLII